MKALGIPILLFITCAALTSAWGISGVSSSQLNDRFIDDLLDPDMQTMPEVAAMRKKCVAVRAALEKYQNLTGEESAALASLHRLISRHLTYNQSGPDNAIIGLSDQRFAVLSKLEKTILLPRPKGFAFVHYEHPSRDALRNVLADKNIDKRLKDFLKKTGTDLPAAPGFGGVGNTATNPGKTRMTRYVSINLDQCLDAETEDGITHKDAVLSHELVHVYVNALMGIKHCNDLPEWFNEGLAVYVAGDGSVEKTTNLGDTTYTQRASACERYKEYQLAFSYLSSIKGESNFESFVRDTIARHDARGPLKTLCGYTTFGEVSAAAERWKNLGDCRVVCIAGMILLGLFGLAYCGGEEGYKGVIMLVLAVVCAVLAFWYIPHLRTIIPA